jgi:hypothetical protein
MKRKFKMYVEEVDNDGSEFQLIFKIDDKVKDIRTEYSIEDCLYESYEFMRRICEKYDFDSRTDKLEINLNFQMGM